VSARASGTFQVKLIPQPAPADGEPAILGRFAIDKQFSGDLDAASKGEMLAAGTDTKGSAGYVALEKVSGKLAGRSGTFYLQHNGIMARGAGRLTIEVVPDSGTGQLAGLAGTMAIKIESGLHSYEFDYTLP
jgi:Protein of unknown function (DUF3224)